MTTSEHNEFSQKADEYILNRDYESLERLVEKLTDQDFEFSHLLYKAHYLYVIANCYSVLYESRRVDWYSDDLMKAVIFYRQALYTIPENDWNEDITNIHAYEDLRAKVLTNLANSLSSQGRVFC